MSRERTWKAICAVIVALAASPSADGQFTFSVDQARVNQQFDAHVSGGIPGTEFMIAVDLMPGPTYIQELNLTVDLGLSDSLFVFPRAFLDATGAADYSVVIADPNEAGAPYYSQAFCLDPIDPFTVVASNSQLTVIHPADAGTGTVTPLTLTDDGSTMVSLPFAFPFYGTNYTDVYVNANGNLTFGQPNGAFIVDEDIFAGGPPCIAPLWADLNPETGGTVETDTTASPSETFTIRWTGVPSNLTGGANTFSVTLLNGGHIAFVYGACDVASAISGITPGGSGTLNVQDLSMVGAWGFALPAPIYEVFGGTNAFDLSNALVTVKNYGSNGYLYYY